MNKELDQFIYLFGEKLKVEEKTLRRMGAREEQLVILQSIRIALIETKVEILKENNDK